MAGAAFGEVHVSLFVAGAAFGEVHVSLFVAGAAFGEAHVSLDVVGAAFGEMWNDSWSGKRCNFQKNLLPASAKSNLGGGGLRFAFSWSDHGRMGLGSWSDRSRIGKTLRSFSANFSKIWVCNFAWQAQYLVRCEGDACCSAHCK